MELFIIVLVSMFISFIFCTIYDYSKPDAVLEIDESDENKDKYKIVILLPFDDLKKKKLLSMRVVKTNSRK